MKKYILAISVLVAVSLGGFYFWTQKSSGQRNQQLDSFAQCLAEKKVTMYGAYWCAHCQNQKKLFGSSFRYVPYVECTKDVQKCQEKQIKGYPTWIFEDGHRIEGEVNLEKLAQYSGCKLE
ncbi:MAG: hypothetical protein HYU80_04065 [Candidatus Blackburnbacteria bacterium]|nr:hypothetical protein [Candidatus Blackburnbacteria bacterium]